MQSQQAAWLCRRRMRQFHLLRAGANILAGETWNVTKIGFQLKQVRERLAKGLVDKGVLRTEKRNFLLFDMATHPVADSGAKDAVLRRVLTLLTSRSGTLPAPSSLYRDEGKAVSAPTTRSLALLCCAFSANVLENALTHLAYDAREAAFQKADDLLADFAQWPMAPRSGAAIGSSVTSSASARKPGIGEGSMSTEAQGAGVSTAELAKAVRAELLRGDAGEAQFETIAAVLHVLSRMDSLVSMAQCESRHACPLAERRCRSISFEQHTMLSQVQDSASVSIITDRASRDPAIALRARI